MSPAGGTPPDWLLPPDPGTRRVARKLLAGIEGLPIVSPHGHVPVGLLADDAAFGTPVDLFLRPDHYAFRMLYSQGIPLEAAGLRPRDRAAVPGEPPDPDADRAAWRTFAANQHLFRGTPTGAWLRRTMELVFGIRTTLDASTANAVYDALAERIADPAYRPRRILERFGIEVICTTDEATDTLDEHRLLHLDGLGGRVRPTFRPDAVMEIAAPGWRAALETLAARAGIGIGSVAELLEALRIRRAAFRALGAVATDHAAATPWTEVLAAPEAEAIFRRALRGAASEDDARRFRGHLLVEMAGMSVEDGLVMQLHPGSFRNHNPTIFDRFGPDKGADIPVAVDFTHGLRALLDRHGNDPRLRLILFTLDETTYARELAPLAGHYPALRLGPPWWFHDSPRGIERYLDRVTETAGIANLAGFNDDSRSLVAIPARHEVWRRSVAGWLAGLVVRHVVRDEEAHEMARDLAVDLARSAYGLPEGSVPGAA